MSVLTQKDLQQLRSKKLIADDETAFLENDILIAENVVTKQRRVIPQDGLLLEGKKQLLKD